jgi:hypothetical protein
MSRRRSDVNIALTTRSSRVVPSHALVRKELVLISPGYLLLGFSSVRLALLLEVVTFTFSFSFTHSRSPLSLLVHDIIMSSHVR